MPEESYSDAEDTLNIRWYPSVYPLVVYPIVTTHSVIADSKKESRETLYHTESVTLSYNRSSDAGTVVTTLGSRMDRSPNSPIVTNLALLCYIVLNYSR